jgi:hypothetical protein
LKLYRIKSPLEKATTLDDYQQELRL